MEMVNKMNIFLFPIPLNISNSASTAVKFSTLP